MRLDFRKRLCLLLCSLRLDSGESDFESWGTYTAVNTLIDLLDAWMVFRVFLNNLVSSELDASANAIFRKLDSCECHKMGCSQCPNYAIVLIERESLGPRLALNSH